jgi:hypothetical protein
MTRHRRAPARLERRREPIAVVFYVYYERSDVRDRARGRS